MASSIDSSSDSDSQDPYSILGLDPGSTFDQIQKARDSLLLEVGDDPKAKAKIEASYDALLMLSLKDRQLGKLSNEAASASKREQSLNKTDKNSSSSFLTRLNPLNLENKNSSLNRIIPDLNFPDSQGLVLRISLGMLAIVGLLLSSSGGIELILSISTIGVFISQVRRGRSVLSSLIWSILLLLIGLIVGGILFNVDNMSNNLAHSFTVEQLEALPAIVLLLIGSLLLS